MWHMAVTVWAITRRGMCATGWPGTMLGEEEQVVLLGSDEFAAAKARLLGI
jgi:hypothetical protein